MKKIIIAITAACMIISSCSDKSKTKDQENTEITKESGAEPKTIHLNKMDFLAKVANYETNPSEWKYLGDKPALIDFYADWCGPCKMIAPHLEDLARDYKNEIYIYKIDVDKEQELAQVFGIRSIPSLLLIPMGENPQMTQGAMSKDDLKDAIDKVLLKK